jgi:hypothetical protein
VRKRFLIVPGVLVTAALVVLAAMPSSSHLPGARPIVAAASHLPAAAGRSRDVAPADPAAADAIEAHLQLALGQGIDAQAALDASLAGLRERPETVGAVAALYDASAADAYLRRWSLLDLDTVLHDRRAGELFAAVVNAPLPADPRSDAFSEETMLRLRALDGLTDLAQHGDPDAHAALLACVSSCPAAIRPSIVQAALLAGGPPETRAQIASALRPDERWMLDQRVGDLATDGASPAPPDDGRHPGAPHPIPQL